MAYEDEDVAAFLADAGGAVTAPDGQSTEAILREGDVFRNDGQQQVKVGTARLIIGTGALTLTRQGLYQYREAEADPPRTFRLKEPERRGAFTHLIVVEETA